MSLGVSDPSSARIEALEALLSRVSGQLTVTSQELATTSQKLAGVTTERDNLRRAYRELMEQFELLRRRIFIAKAERIDATQLELEFEETKKKLDELAAQLAGGEGAPANTTDTTGTPGSTEAPGSRPAGKPLDKPKAKPKGRRNLADADLPERRIEIRDAALEDKGTFIGWEESYKLGYQRPEAVRVVIARAKYKTAAEQTAVNKSEGPSPSTRAGLDAENGACFTIRTAHMPPLLVRRGLLAPSMIARIIVQKFRSGMPYFRQEEQLGADGIALDRGTMARTVEEVGAGLGAIVIACADDARKNAFCLATDATGVAIRPEPLADGRRQPCKRGHFFVVLADKKHVFFEYQAKHTSAAVCEMFRGFSGYLQADAHAIYDALFRGEAVDDPNDAPIEVACWAHCRRRFWEAAVSGFAVGREGLLRIRKIYQLDQSWSDLAPAARLERRRSILKPFVDELFDWVRAQQGPECTERGMVKNALGYAVRQETGLRRFLEEGRLRMDNNPSENALRLVATGRKAWLFFGSDDHAEAAANLFSLIASCKLHGLDPERYLAEIIRILPYWPRHRFLDLAPAYWAETRARLDPTELAVELGHITVPSPLPRSTQEPSPD